MIAGSSGYVTVTDDITAGVAWGVVVITSGWVWSEASF